jgi:hypothetical protein
MNNRNSVNFVGHSGLLFTDENGETFCVYTETLRTGKSDMVLYSNDIKPLGCNRELTDNDREKIISKILELTKYVEWQIKE